MATSVAILVDPVKIRKVSEEGQDCKVNAASRVQFLLIGRQKVRSHTSVLTAKAATSPSSTHIVNRKRGDGLRRKYIHRTADFVKPRETR